jgi:hypothetical protein
MKLDFNRPYGTVHGDSEAAFEQDGVLFDSSGDKVRPSTTPDPDPRPEDPPPKPAKK